MIEVKAPTNPILSGVLRRKVFLAGSIEQGVAAQWQSLFVERLSDINQLIVYNPRRDFWDASWDQTVDNPQLVEQINWELDRLNEATIIPMYFDPNTKSPITLLELGLYALSDKLIVCCPAGFYRKANVDVMCSRFGIPQVDSLDELITLTRERLV